MRALMSMHSACVCWRWQQVNIRTENAQIQLRSTAVLPLYVPQTTVTFVLLQKDAL